MSNEEFGKDRVELHRIVSTISPDNQTLIASGDNCSTSAVYSTSVINKPTDVSESNIHYASIVGTIEAPKQPNVGEEQIQITNGTEQFRRNKPKQKTSHITVIELNTIDVEEGNDAHVYENDSNVARNIETLKDEVLRSKVSWYRRPVWRVLFICIIPLIGITAGAQWIYVWRHSKGI